MARRSAWGCVLSGEPGREDDAAVVLQTIQPPEPAALIGPDQGGVCLGGDGEDQLGVGGADRSSAGVGRELLPADRADGLEHREGGLVPIEMAPEETVRDQRWDIRGGARRDGHGLVPREPAGEHRQPAERVALTGSQEVGAPRHGVVERPLAVRQVDRGGAGREAGIGETGQECRRAEQVDPGGGELDREREAVQAAADLGDDRPVLGRNPERCVDRAGAVRE